MQTIHVQTRVGMAPVGNIFPVLDHATGNVTAWQFRLTLDSGDDVTLTEDFQIPTEGRKPIAQWRTRELASLIRSMATNAKVHVFVQAFEEQRAYRLDTTFTDVQLIDDGA